MRRCPPDRPSFRQLQCSHFNPMPYKGKLYKWTPVPNNCEWRAWSSNLGTLEAAVGCASVASQPIHILCFTPWLGSGVDLCFGMGLRLCLFPSEPL